MRIDRSRRSVTILAAVATILAGCAAPRSYSRGSASHEQPCSVSRGQLARATERTLHAVLERHCPAVAHLTRTRRPIRVLIMQGAGPADFGNAESLYTVRPSDVMRVRFLPRGGIDGIEGSEAMVLIEPRWY
jgi:hypothetical protein